MFHTLSTKWDYKQDALRKETLIVYFLDHFKKIKIWYMSIFSFVILDVLYSLPAPQRYKQSALRKKDLIAFFETEAVCGANQWTGFYMITGSVLKELNENTTCIVKVKRVVSWSPCARQGFFKMRSAKEAVIMDSFVERLKKIHENIKA